MNYPATSLMPMGSASTVALRVLMDKAQKLEIGQRIRALREDSAETNRSIADYCGVSVEAVRNWIAGKGIAYDNGEKVAELFGVRFDWLWRGKGHPQEPSATPDVIGALSGQPAPEDFNDEDARLLSAQLAALHVDVAALAARIEELWQRSQEPPEELPEDPQRPPPSD